MVGDQLGVMYINLHSLFQNKNLLNRIKVDEKEISRLYKGYQ